MWSAVRERDARGTIIPACWLVGMWAALGVAAPPPSQPQVVETSMVRAGISDQRRIRGSNEPGLLMRSPHGPAHAPRQAVEPADGGTDSGPGRQASGPGAFSSGFEPPCFVGYIGGGSSGQPQNCVWHASSSAETDCTQPRITNLMPATGAQHLRFQYDPNQPSNPNARNWAFSDNITPVPLPGVVSLSLKLRISATDGLNTFSVRPQAPSQATVTAEMQFTPDGMIYAFEDPTPGDGTIDALPTGYTWTPGVYKDVSICVDTLNNRIRYFYDGDLVWSTGAGEGGLGTGIFAGDIIEHVVLRSLHNYSDTVTMNVDSVVIEPNACLEPTGACCDIDGAGVCLRTTQAACEASPTGIFAGINSECSPQVCAGAGACGQPGSGSCFEPGGLPGPGCEDLECCLAVCLRDPFCCEVAWDQICVDAANANCPSSGLCPGAGDADCQDLSTSDALNSTTGGFRVADSFRPAIQGGINSVCWKGAYLPAEGQDDFTIRYYPCLNGVPDSNHPLASFSQSAGTLVDVVRQQTGLFIDDSDIPIYEYAASHATVPVSANQVYFIEIVNSTGTSSTWFWSLKSVTDGEGDGESFQIPDGLPHARYACVHEDLSFCLDSGLAPISGQCPLPAPQPCELDLSMANMEEAEVCGQFPDANLGCSVTPPGAYTELSPSTNPADPTVVHGLAWAEEGALPGQDRDVDWYRFTVPEGVDADGDGQVVACVRANSEMPLKALMITDDFVDGECGKVAVYSLDAVGFECAPSLAVGYVLFDQTENLIVVRTADCDEVFDGVPCGGDGISTLGNDYLLEVALTDDFEDCFGGSPGCPSQCPADLNRNGTVNAADLALLLGDWGPDPQSCADFNRNGIINAADLAQLLGNWGPC